MGAHPVTEPVQAAFVEKGGYRILADVLHANLPTRGNPNGAAGLQIVLILDRALGNLVETRTFLRPALFSWTELPDKTPPFIKVMTSRRLIQAGVSNS